MEKIIFCTILILGFNTNFSFAQVTTEAAALKYIRAAAKRLTLTDIRAILLHPTMQNCMARLTREAKQHDRGRKGLESAVWVMEHNESNYSCHFWPDRLRVPRGFDWDGFIPRQTVFSIHTHPKNSGGPRPSKEDYEFNRSIGKIGLIFSLKQKVISANYPGSRKYPRLIKSREFRNIFLR